jgi:hypothetical protein
MQVVISKTQLEAAHACADYFTSSEWNGEALVYADWAKTVERLLSTGKGTLQLGWLVKHGLVPMTREEFVAARAVAHPKTARTVSK